MSLDQITVGMRIRADGWRRIAYAAASAAILFAFVAGHARAEVVRIAVGVDPTFLAFFVAKHEKLFEKNGVDVQLVSFASGGSIIDGMIAGQAAMASSSETTTIGRMARAGNMRALAVTGQSGDNTKLVARGDIDNPRKIKTYGTLPGGVFEYLTGLTMKKYGVDPATVKIIKAGAPELPALLSRGDIDAFWLFEPFPSQAVKQGARILAHTKHVGYINRSWISTTSTWLETHREEARRVILSLDAACQVAKSNPDRAAAAVHAQVKIPVKQTLDFLTELECIVQSIPRSDAAGYQEIAAFLAESKITPTLVNVAEKIEFDFLAK